MSLKRRIEPTEKRMNITVKESTHSIFKSLADEAGMKYDAYLMKVIRQSQKFEIMKGA